MSKFLNWLKSLFTPAVKAFISAVFTKARTELIDALKDIAVLSVAEAQATGLSSEEKRKAVFSKIKEYAKSRGIEAKDSIVNLVIELAVSAVKGDA